MTTLDFNAEVVADSVSPAGVRLTTMVVTFPRMILAEMNTHRMFSRNSASSRAIPVAKQIERVLSHPFVPAGFASNKKGMQAGDVLDVDDRQFAEDAWLKARDRAVRQAKTLAEIGVHKQWANRLLEPFAWHTAIISATEWDNFWGQRCHPNAQPEMRTTAELMREAFNASTPRSIDYDEWHLPFIKDEGPDAELNDYDKRRVSTARCARVSYLTHDGKRDADKDVELHEFLLGHFHMSPFEHPATPIHMRHPFDADGDPASCWPDEEAKAFEGNFRGWTQWRKHYMLGALLAQKHANSTEAVYRPS